MLIDQAKYALAKEVVNATKKYLKSGHKAFLRSLLFKAIINEHIANPTAKTEKFLNCMIANTKNCKPKLVLAADCSDFSFVEFKTKYSPQAAFTEPASLVIEWDL
jgi:hypothetical protein